MNGRNARNGRHANHRQTVQPAELDITDNTCWNHPWQFPDCPECSRHIYVDRYTQPDNEFICHKCGPFNKSKADLREELRQ